MLKLVEFSKISIEIKNCNTFCKAPIPPREQTLLRLGNNFFKEIYTNIFAFKVIQECSSWASRNGVVQIFFLTPHRNIFAGKFVRKVFGCFGSILLSMSSDLRMSEVFQRNCITKCLIFFASFCWFLGFLLEILKLKKNL